MLRKRSWACLATSTANTSSPYAEPIRSAHEYACPKRKKEKGYDANASKFPYMANGRELSPRRQRGRLRQDRLIGEIVMEAAEVVLGHPIHTVTLRVMI
ncbi:hypothetical protein [Paenibacillus dendritiformis]|uniref:hypothetical protein n=1 Tax=Paenibacillus dendritiformis TaxID=130049 RepID=UPI003B96D0AE